MAPDYRISEKDKEAFERFMDTAGFPYKKIESTPKSFTNSDFIQYKKVDGAIANSSIGDFHFGKNWYNQNKAVLRKELIMQDSAEAMAMYLAIVDAYINGTKLYHPDSNNPFVVQKDQKGNVLQERVKESIIADLYRKFTQNNWQNLNNFFEKNESGILVMKKAIGLDEDENLLYSNPEEIKYLDKRGVLVNLNDFNKKGLVTKMSRKKIFDKNKNVYFYPPLNGRVAQLGSDVDYSIWNGYNVPGDDNGSVGVKESLPTGSENKYVCL